MAPGPWLSARCPPGRPAGHDAQVSTSLSSSMAEEQPSSHSHRELAQHPVPQALLSMSKTGLSHMDHHPLGYSSKEEGSLRKDRNWYVAVFFPFDHILSSTVPADSFLSPTRKHISETTPALPCHPKSQHPHPTPIPTQTPPISPKHRGSPKALPQGSKHAIPGRCWLSARWAPPPGG